MFEPDARRDLLADADGVVHSITTIQDQAEGVTFDRVNAESALLTVKEAVDAGVESFVFLSVRDKPPLIPSASLTDKGRAERSPPAVSRTVHGRTSGLVELDAITARSLAPALAALGGAAFGTWLLRRWWS